LKYWMWQLNNEISLIKCFVNEIVVSLHYTLQAVSTKSYITAPGEASRHCRILWSNSV